MPVGKVHPDLPGQNSCFSNSQNLPLELDWKDRKGSKKKLGMLTIAIIILIGIEICSIRFTFRTNRATRSGFLILQKVKKFTTTNDFTDLSGYPFITGYSASPNIYYDLAVSAIEAKSVRFNALAQKFKHHKKMVPILRKTNSKFQAMSRTLDAVLSFQYNLAQQGLNENKNNTQTMTFDNYVTSFNFLIQQEGTPKYKAYDQAILDFIISCEQISSNGQASILIFTVCIQFVLFFLLIFLIWLLRSVFAEASLEIITQEKLVRQESHEQRSKFCIGINCLEFFLDMIQRANIQIQDFVHMKDDFFLALVALREVEKQHRTRLDLYKIMRKTYALRPEIFNIIDLFREKLNIEKGIAQATIHQNQKFKNSMHHKSEDFVDFILKIKSNSFCHEENTQANNGTVVGAVYVKCDSYILNHIIQNLLSNARKHCYHGSIVLTFDIEKSKNNFLFFSCRDTGIGVNPQLQKRLFKTEVAVGEIRGTGLGLASCSLFCQAAGGWIKLKDTAQQDDAGNNGFSEFEFAIQGQVIRVDTPDKQKVLSPQSYCQEVLSPSMNESQNTASGGANYSPPTEAKVVPPASDSDNEEEIIQSPSMHTPPNTDSVAINNSPPAEARAVPSASTEEESLDDIFVVIVDDSTLIQNCILRNMKRIQADCTTESCWNYDGIFETIESAMPYIRKIHETNQKAIIVLDEHLESKGGVLTGTQGIRWIIEELGYENAIIISASGDNEIGTIHLSLGASLIWGKPFPKYRIILDDLYKIMQEKGWLSF